MSEVEDFWGFVARERAALGELEEQGRMVPDLLTWLEREIAAAREAAFSATMGQRNGAEYWSGYADALADVVNAIKRRGVRV